MEKIEQTVESERAYRKIVTTFCIGFGLLGCLASCVVGMELGRREMHKATLNYLDSIIVELEHELKDSTLRPIRSEEYKLGKLQGVKYLRNDLYLTRPTD